MPRTLDYASPVGALTVAARTLGVVTPAGAQAATGGTELARDSFSRQVSGRWGRPELGGAYALDPSSSVTLGGSGTETIAAIPIDQGLTAQLLVGFSKPIHEMGPDQAAYAWIAVPIPADVALATGLPAGAKLMGVH